VEDDSRQDTTAVQPYNEMQKSMMDELDRRRYDWEKEMQRMQEDFFKVSSSASVFDGRLLWPKTN